MSNTRPQFPGDPKHPEHDVYLIELGRATYSAARLAGIAFDVLRVHGGVDSAALYSDPLGKLEKRLRASPPPLDGIQDFLHLLSEARTVRNDLIHALPVKHGLHRPVTNDPSYVRDFYTVESLQDARVIFDAAWTRGSEVLYEDGGVAVHAWYNVE